MKIFDLTLEQQFMSPSELMEDLAKKQKQKQINMEAKSNTNTVTTPLDDMSDGQKRRVLKYFDALKELRSVLKYTDYIKMSQFMSERKLNNGLPRLLIEGGILGTNGKKASAMRYKWLSIDPTLHMAITAVSRLSMVHKNQDENSTEKAYKDIADGKIDFGNPNGHKSFPFPPEKPIVNTFTSNAEPEFSRETPKMKTMKIPSDEEIKEATEKMIPIMTPMLEKMVSGMVKNSMPQIKKTVFSLFWGLIKYVKIK